MTTLRPIYDCPAYGWHAYIDGSIHDGPAAGCEVCAMEDARRAKLGLPTSADVPARTEDDTCTRSMRVPAGRPLSQYERDKLAAEIERAAPVPYEYEEPQEDAHKPTPFWTWVGIAAIAAPWVALAVIVAWLVRGGP